MSHGFDRKYTKTLPTWRDKWWKTSKAKRKHWSELDYYVQNPDAALRRKLWESGERDFATIWHAINGDQA